VIADRNGGNHSIAINVINIGVSIMAKFKRDNPQQWGHPVKNPVNGKIVAWINMEDSLSPAEFKAIEPVVVQLIQADKLQVDSFRIGDNQVDEDANGLEGLDLA
jgi:hypothetical protein